MKRALGLLLFLAPDLAWAHGGGERSEAAISVNNLAMAAVIAAFLLLFRVGWSRMPRRSTGEPAVVRWQAALFVGGLLCLAAVLLPPFDELADVHFSAHMVQHLVLLVLAPPMLAGSQAQIVMLHAFKLDTRRRIGRLFADIPGFRFVSHSSSTVWFVCLSSVAVLWFWHWPRAYDYAREHELVHDLEHLLFLLTELAFWRVILFRREAELSRAGAALILVAMSVQGGLLAALITFARSSLYQSYGVSPAAVADQALGGVMMWVIAGTIYLGGFAILFVRAMKRSRSGRGTRRFVAQEREREATGAHAFSGQAAQRFRR